MSYKYRQEVHRHRHARTRERLDVRRAAVSVMLVACSLVATVTLTSAQSFTTHDVSPLSDNVGRAIQAVDGRGNAMFMWFAGPGAIRTARYDVSTDTLSAPIDGPTNPGLDASRTSLVLDQAGNATAFGPRYTTGDTEIVAARYSAATGQWGTFTTLMSQVPVAYGGFRSIPVGVVDAAGNVTVIWWQATCDGCTAAVLYAARYSAGGWTVRSIADNVWWQLLPSVAIDGSGNVLAIAARARSGVTLLAARYAPSSDAWSVSDGPGIDSHTEFLRASLVATTEDGRALVTYQGSFGLNGVRFHMPTGSWGLLRPLSSTLAAIGPSVATDQSGNFMVTWHTALTGSMLPTLLSRRYSWNTDTREDPVLLPTVAPGGARVAVGGDGIPTLVWLDVGAGQSAILKAARYNPVTSEWTDAGEITSVPSAGHLVIVGLSVDAAGGIRVSWLRRPDSSGNTILQTTRWVPSTATPGPPGNLRAAVSGNTVTFTWSAPTTGAAPTGYSLVVRATAGGPVIATVPMGAGLVFTATAPNGTFTVSVRATNENGAGPESPAVTLRVPEGATPPGAPNNLTGNVAGTTVSFSWSAPASGGPVTGYVLVVGLTPGFSVPFTTIPVGASTSFAATGAPPGTYYVRVQAQNTGGAGPPSNEVALTVAGLTAPEPPTLHTPVVSGSTVSLSWSPGGGGAPTGYTLSASLAPDGAPIATVPLGGTTASFAGVPAGTYYLRLTASNAAGTSPPSAEVSLIVP